MFDSKDRLPCFRKLVDGLRCASCRSGPCSFRSTNQIGSLSSSTKIIVERVVGRLEALVGMEDDNGRKDVLDKCRG